MYEAEQAGFAAILPPEEEMLVAHVPTVCPKCNELVEPTEEETLLRAISQTSINPSTRSTSKLNQHDSTGAIPLHSGPIGRRSNVDLRDMVTNRRPLSNVDMASSYDSRDTLKQRSSMIDNPKVSLIGSVPSTSAMSQKSVPGCSSGSVSRKSLAIGEGQTDIIERIQDDYIESAYGPTLKEGGFGATSGSSKGAEASRVDDDDSDKTRSRKHARFTFDLTCNSEFISAAQRAAEQAEEFLLRIWRRGWDVVTHSTLPTWLRDNEYLRSGHRPELHSYAACFRSMFRIHTETGNIWTHLLGSVAFIGVAAYFLTRPNSVVQWQEKVVFGTFFVGAICCLGLSCSFHTFCCHSQPVGKLFAKLDYCGIAVLIIASFVPWLYYSFYCDPIAKIIYLIVTTVLGITCIIASLWDKFAEPKLRPLRAGVFIGFGLSGIVPAIHVMIVHGFVHAINNASLGWLSLMALLYIGGALIYAFRIPERLLPGKFDIWGQSHQIFHIFVVAAAFVHFHGITAVATYRLTLGDCVDAHLASELDALY